MHFVGLAAGRGKRLNPLTNVLQKTMYPIVGKPFLEYTLEQIARVFQHGEDTLTLVVGHHADQVQGYFGTAWGGLPINYVRQTEQWGTAHAIYSAHTALRFSGPVIAWLGDVYFTAETIERVAKRDAITDALTYLSLVDTPEKAAAPLMVTGNLVSHIPWEFAETEDVGNAADIGLWRLQPETLDVLPEVNRNGEWRTVRALALRMQNGYAVEAVRSPEWIHLGNTPSMVDRLLRVTKRLAAPVPECPPIRL